MQTVFRALAGACAFAALGGCAIVGGHAQSDPVTVYALDAHPAAHADWPTANWALSIAPTSAAPMLDSARIVVRPTPDELQVYHGVSWSQPAPQLLEDAVLRALEDSGKIRAVARQSSGIRADCKLVLDVRHFEAQYPPGADAKKNDAAPSAVIEVSAKLLSQRDQQVIAARSFVQSTPADGKEPARVAAAFQQSLDAVSAQVALWALQNGTPQGAK